MDESVIGLAVAGLLVLGLGILIRFAGMVELIAGYDPDRVADEEGLASVVGANVIAVGLLGIGCAAVLYFEPVSDPSFVWIGFVVGTFAFAFRAIRGASRYEIDALPSIAFEHAGESALARTAKQAGRVAPR